MSDTSASGLHPYLGTANRRRSLLQSLILLTIFAAVLLIFIGWLGDWRRRHNIDTLMNTQARSYTSMTTDAGVLPLNLRPDLPLGPSARLIDGWLSPDEARVLRGSAEEVVVAWTVPLVRALGRNERAVIVFHQGKYGVRWVTLEEFNQLYARQAERIKSTSESVP